MTQSSTRPAGSHDGGRPVSRAQEAAELGISERHLRRLRAREAAGEAPWAVDIEAIPHVPIVDGPTDRRWYYDLGDDARSRLPLGLMRVAEGSAHDRRGGAPTPSSRPARLEGKLAIHHFNEAFTEPPGANPRRKFRPKKPKKSKDLP